MKILVRFAAAIILPLGPGSGVDISARLLAERLPSVIKMPGLKPAP